MHTWLEPDFDKFSIIFVILRKAVERTWPRSDSVAISHHDDKKTALTSRQRRTLTLRFKGQVDGPSGCGHVQRAASAASA